MNSTRLLATTLIILTIIGPLSIKPGFSSTSDIKIGFFYYVWYTGQPGQGHWNGNSKWTVVDKPLLDYYNSSDPKVIKQHLEWFNQLNINFIIISWWGSNTLGGNMFNEDTATKQVFECINETKSNVKAALMIEDFNNSGNYNFKAIYDYINTTYLAVYPNEFFDLDNKPLICWWNAPNVTGTLGNPNATNIQSILSDSRFEARIVGHDDYVNWTAWRPNSIAGQNDSSVLPKLSTDGFTCIEPRFDDSNIGGSDVSDPNYSEGMYDNQWNWVKSNSGVKIVAIYSWNEYHERSQIEPHADPNGAQILLPFSKTYHYIQVIPEIQPPFISLLFIIMTLPAIIYRRMKKQH